MWLVFRQPIRLHLGILHVEKNSPTLLHSTLRRMKLPKKLALLARYFILACIFLRASTAQAFNTLYSQSKHDNSLPIPYYINLGVFSTAANRSNLIQGIRNAFQHVQDEPHSHLTFDYKGETTVLPGNDAVSVVYLDVNHTYAEGAGITTGFNIANGRILTADIALDGPEYVSDPYGNLYALTQHELMHFLGFAHSSTGTDSVVYANTVNLQLSPDDIAGLATLYPEPANPLAAVTATVTGRVLWPDGRPVPARLVAYDSTKSQPRVITKDTNGDGTFQLPGLPPGNYHIAAETVLVPGQSATPFLHRLLNGGAVFTVSAGQTTVAADLTVEEPFFKPVYSGRTIYRARIHSQSGLIYCNSSDYHIRAIQPDTGAVVATMEIFGTRAIFAWDIAFTPDGNTLCYVDQYYQKMGFIDVNPASATRHRIFAEIPIEPEQPTDLVIADNGLAYISTNGGGSVVVVNTVTRSVVTTIFTAEYNQGITLSPDQRRVWLGTYIGESGIAEIDIEAGSPTRHTILHRFSAGSNSAWQIRQISNGLLVQGTKSGLDIRNTQGSLLGQVQGGRSAFSVPAVGGGRYAAFTAYDDPERRNNELWLYDSVTRSVVERIPVGGDYYYTSEGVNSTEVIVAGESGLTRVRPASLSGLAGPVAPLSLQHPPEESSGEIAVFAGPSAQTWQFSALAAWILPLQPFYAAGNGWLRYRVTENTSALSREGVLRVNGQDVHIKQSGVILPPVLYGNRSLTAVKDSPLSLQLRVWNLVQSFRVTGLPPGLTLAPLSGLMTGTPALNGVFNPVFFATNGAGDSPPWTMRIIITDTQKPDIAITSLHVTSVSASTATIQWTLVNCASVPITFALNIGVQKWLSSDQIGGNADDKAAGGYSFRAGTGYLTLAAGEGKVFNDTITRPAGTQFTHPYAVLTLDNFNLLAESDETNNAASIALDGLSFDLWRKLNFTAPELANAAISGPDANPDGDGAVNFAEFVFGTHPKTASAIPLTILPLTSRDHAAVRFSLPYDIRKGFTWTLEGSATLQPAQWTPLYSFDPATLSGLPAGSTVQDDGLWRHIVAEDTVPIASGTHRFLRLRAANP